MNILLSIVALVVLVSGIYFRHQPITQTDFEKSNPEVLSETNITGVSENSTPTLGSETVDSIALPTPTASIVVSLGTKPKIVTIDPFIYPNSTIVNESGLKITITSGDSPDIITNWYKAKIKNLAASVRSFVTTRTNDTVLNKLVGANTEFEVTIEIAKKPGDANTTMTIELVDSKLKTD